MCWGGTVATIHGRPRCRSPSSASRSRAEFSLVEATKLPQVFGIGFRPTGAAGRVADCHHPFRWNYGHFLIRDGAGSPRARLLDDGIVDLVAARMIRHDLTYDGLNAGRRQKTELVPYQHCRGGEREVVAPLAEIQCRRSIGQLPRQAGCNGDKPRRIELPALSAKERPAGVACQQPQVDRREALCAGHPGYLLSGSQSRCSALPQWLGFLEPVCGWLRRRAQASSPRMRPLLRSRSSLR